MCHEEEEWRPVPEYEEYYECSTLGRIRTFPRRSWNGKCWVIRKVKYLKLIAVDNSRYLTANFTGKNGPKTVNPHVFIARAFIPNPENKPMVNYIDGVKINCAVRNMEWATRSENAIHSFKIGLQTNAGENHLGHKLTDNQVLNIIKIRKDKKTTYVEIAKMFGVSKTTVMDICNHKTWTHL